jgi:hypothetical protein
MSKIKRIKGVVIDFMMIKLIKEFMIVLLYIKTQKEY